MRVVEEMLAVGDPEHALYRNRTVALLEKYFRMSVELGHLPSVMGREFFRSHVSSYGTQTFEDAVIFVHDVERCLEQIDPRHQLVITRLFFQQYTNEEAAKLIDCGHTTIVRRRQEALDAITSVFLNRKLLEPMPVLAYDGEKPREVKMDLPPKKRARGVKSIQAVAGIA